jgi:Arm DNA-binding domain
LARLQNALGKDGKPAWGYSFFASRTPAGKRIQITKSGFDTRKEAAEALRKAIEHHRFDGNGANRLKFSAFMDRWLDEYAKHRCAAKTLECYVTLGR